MAGLLTPSKNADIICIHFAVAKQHGNIIYKRFRKERFMDNIRFSVIMPVYGTEKYLAHAIDSVLIQDYTDFELILVDDKSKDSCPQICDDYAQKDKRIRVIHKPENQGLGMARNTGLCHANGEYVVFMDSDDTIEPYALKTINNALNNNEDILCFGMRKVYTDNNDNIIATKDFSCCAFTGNTLKDSGEAFLLLTKSKLFQYSCGKAYRTHFLKDSGILFEKTKLIEDFLFNINLFSLTQNISIIPDCLYIYLKPQHQTLASAYSPEFYELSKRKFLLESEFIIKTGIVNNESRQMVLRSHINHILSTFTRNKSKKAGLSAKEQKQQIRAILNDGTTIETLKEFQPKNIVYRIIVFLFKNKCVNTCYLLAGIIGKLKKS